MSDLTFSSGVGSLKGFVPLFIGLIVAVFGTIPLGLTNVPAFAPFLTLMVVFYWSTERPSTMPPLAAFIIGLWQDVLLGTPLGMTSIILLLARTVATEQNIVVFSQSFILAWVGFAVICTAMVLLSWLLGSWWQGAVLSIAPYAIQWLMSLLIYPFVAGVFRLTSTLLYRNHRK